MTNTIHQELTPYQLCVTGNYSVVPSGGGKTGKSPLVDWERYQNEAPTLDDIGRWEKELHPRLWGVVTGKLSGVVVIDLDKPELRAIFDKAGLLPHIQTPRGGFHYWFKHPGNPVKTATGILEGIDVRGDGGFINAIGQRDDGSYRVLIAPLPDTLYPWDKLPTQIAKALGKQRSQAPPVEGGIIPATKRNATLAKLAGKLRTAGLSEDAIGPALQAINLASCKPPLDPDEVASIAHSIAKYRASGNVGTDQGRPTLPYATDTDIANAERLVALHGDDLRFCYHLKKWLVWTGKLWKPDMGALINRRAKETVRHIYIEAAKELDDKRRGDIVTHAKRSESDSRVKAMISRAESEVPIDLTELDTDHLLLNCQNGIVDLTTGELRPHDKTKLMTQAVATNYDPDAKCPLWLNFLEWATGGDQELMTYLQRAMGYSLTGDVTEQILFFVYGLGGNGKTTLTMTFRTLMGDYGGKLEADDLMMKERKLSGPKEAIADLFNKRYALGSEVRDGRRLDVGMVKDMCGGESMAADRKWEHRFEFIPIFKLWLYGNKQPTIQDRSLAIWRRVKMIRFEQTISDDRKDGKLRSKMEKDELPGILAWAVRGCLDWQREGLNEPKSVTDATQNYKEEQDVLGEWIWECCHLDYGADILKAGLRASYERWCNDNKVDPLKVRPFKENLVERGIRDHRGTAGKHYWKGIRLLTEREIQERLNVEVTEVTTDYPKSHILSMREKFTKENMENGVTTVTGVTSDTGDNSDKTKVSSIRPLPSNYPPYPGKPCSDCGSDLFWPGEVGWRCCTCDPRPDEDD